MEKSNNEQILQALQEIQSSIDCMSDGDNSFEIMYVGEKIEAAVLVAAIMIAKPADPQKAIIDAYSVVNVFQSEQRKREKARIQKRIKELELEDDEDEDEK